MCGSLWLARPPDMISPCSGSQPDVIDIHKCLKFASECFLCPKRYHDVNARCGIGFKVGWDQRTTGCFMRVGGCVAVFLQLYTMVCMWFIPFHCVHAPLVNVSVKRCLWFSTTVWVFGLKNVIERSNLIHYALDIFVLDHCGACLY